MKEGGNRHAGAHTYVHEQIKSSSTVSRLGKSKMADCGAGVGEKECRRARQARGPDTWSRATAVLVRLAAREEPGDACSEGSGRRGRPACLPCAQSRLWRLHPRQDRESGMRKPQEGRHCTTSRGHEHKAEPEQSEPGKPFVEGLPILLLADPPRLLLSAVLTYQVSTASGRSSYSHSNK